MERIDRFDATIAFVLDVFFLKSVFDGFLGGFELLVGFLEAISGKRFKFFIAFRINIHEARFLNFDTDAPHLEAVGEWGEDFKRFFSNFLLFFGRKGAERTEIMEAIGYFNN